MSNYATSPIPGASVYAEKQLQALDAYNRAKQNIRNRQNSYWQQYGFTGEVDPATGAASNVRVDPNNQYGQLQQMLKSTGSSMDQAREGGYARGLGGTGLGAQDESEARYAYGAANNAFQQDFTGNLGQLARNWGQAGADYSSAMTDAEHTALLDSIAAGKFNTAPAANDPSSGTTPTATTPSTASVSPAMKPSGGPLYNYGRSFRSNKELAQYVQSHGGSAPLNALQARSKAMNAQYGLGGPKPAPVASPVSGTYRGRH